MLHLEGLQLKFGNQSVLDNASARMTPGVAVLNGRNGSGKTSLLKIVAGLLYCKGTVACAGIDLA
ncbi:MAG: ATP-binding cassette domain-containing protein, partial [Sphingobacteriales bacterium]